MGRMTFKVVGKTALRDDLQKGIAICNIMEEGRWDILLTPLGVYGHTVTAANIITGIFRHGMDDSDFMAEYINAPRRNNKALVQTQAWTPYKNLFSTMAFQQYQLAANMTEDSIRSIHFVQLKLAVERNYLLQSWHDWILHLEGSKAIIWGKPIMRSTWTPCPTRCERSYITSPVEISPLKRRESTCYGIHKR
jgi:hypothetical protein